MKRALFRAFFALISSRAVSLLLKGFTRSRLSRVCVPLCVRIFCVNTEEMSRPADSYGSLHDLFTRRLRNGSRLVDPHPDAVVSPVDGLLSCCDTVVDGYTFTVKGQTYDLQEMMGDAERAKPYCSGHLLIVYLSPRDYHRIHSPITGTIERRWELGLKSHPVNPTGLKWGKRPLSRNHRVITEFAERGRRVALVMVGAICVNSIEITSETTAPSKGEELAYFSLGSTVVMLFERGGFKPDERIDVPQYVRMGMRLGMVCR